jgi:hypothetical protein
VKDLPARTFPASTSAVSSTLAARPSRTFSWRHSLLLLVRQLRRSTGTGCEGNLSPCSFASC